MTNFQKMFKDLVYITRIENSDMNFPALGFPNLRICKMETVPSETIFAANFVAVVSENTFVPIKTEYFRYEHPKIPGMYILIQITNISEQTIDAAVIIQASYKKDGSVSYRIPRKTSYYLTTKYLSQLPLKDTTIIQLASYQQDTCDGGEIYADYNNERIVCQTINVEIKRLDDYTEISLFPVENEEETGPV